MFLCNLLWSQSVLQKETINFKKNNFFYWEKTKIFFKCSFSQKKILCETFQNDVFFM